MLAEKGEETLNHVLVEQRFGHSVPEESCFLEYLFIVCILRAIIILYVHLLYLEGEEVQEGSAERDEGGTAERNKD